MKPTFFLRHSISDFYIICKYNKFKNIKETFVKCMHRYIEDKKIHKTAHKLFNTLIDANDTKIKKVCKTLAIRFYCYEGVYHMIRKIDDTRIMEWERNELISYNPKYYLIDDMVSIYKLLENQYE